MTKAIKTPEQIAAAKAKKAIYDRERRARIKAAAITEEVNRLELLAEKRAEIVHMSPEMTPELPINKRDAWKQGINFTGAVEVNRQNVRNFYKKSGYIKVEDPSGKILHVGKTTNMGKVFSNYVNCANYNQSYAFNLEGGDRLFFVSAEL